MGNKKNQVWVKLVSLIIATAMILGNGVDVWALRTNATKGTGEQTDITQKLWQYGFEGRGLTVAQNRADEAIAATFARKAAINLIGHQAVLNLDEAVDDYIKASGEKDVSKEILVKRLIMAKDFLTRAVDNDDSLLELLDKVSQALKDDVKERIANDKALRAYNNFLINLMEVNDSGTKEEKLKLAKKVFIEDTRWPVLLLGRNASEASLWSLGDPQSDIHKAVVAHTGTWPYAGSEDIRGGARSKYLALARLEGYAKRGDEGLATFQEVVIHEFKDWVRKAHEDETPELTARVNKINREIDKELGISQEERLAILTEDSDKVAISTHYHHDKTGKTIPVAFRIVSKTHPKIDPAKGQMVIVSHIKADVGSLAGHVKPSPEQMMVVRDKIAAAAARGVILSAFVWAVGDDIQITMTHNKGRTNVEIGKLAGEALLAAGIVAAAQNLYAAGQDILRPDQVTAGNIAGAGPGIFDETFLERKGEIYTIAASDKMGPGDLNRIPIKAVLDPFFSSFPTLKTGRRFRADILEFHSGKVLPLVVETMEDYQALIYFAGFPGYYAIESMYLVGVKQKDGTWKKANEPLWRNTASRLREIAGAYVGKDDPAAGFRTQGDFPATGIWIDTVATGTYSVEGWMMGSHHGPLFPVSLVDAVIGRYDGLPLMVMLGFNINKGVLSEPEDFLGGPSYDEVRMRRLKQAEAMRLEGFVEPHRLSKDDMEYQAAAAEFNKLMAQKGTVPTTADRIANSKTKADIDNIITEVWGSSNIAVVAREFPTDIHQLVAPNVLEINNAEKGTVYPILVNQSFLESLAGVMSLRGIIEQLGNRNIKVVVQIESNDEKLATDEKLLNEKTDKILDKINELTGGPTIISRNMLAAVVVGIDPVKVAAQVKEKVGADIYQVYGPESYVKQFKDLVKVRIILNPADKEKGLSDAISIAKAFKLGLNLIPADGKMTNDELKKLDALFSVDEGGNFHVASADVVVSVVSAAEEYAKQVEAEIRV